jgi:hypothetical protein
VGRRGREGGRRREGKGWGKREVEDGEEGKWKDG